MTKSQLFFAAKLLLGFALIAVLLMQGDVLQQTLQVLSQLDLIGVALVLLMPIPLVWASCIKWQLLLNYRDIRVGLAPLMRFYTVGYFFNNFLPSSLGGDAARSYLVGKRIGSQTESLAAVVLERLTGLVTLVALAFIGFVATPAIHGDVLVTGSLTILGVGCVVLMALIWAPQRLVGPLETGLVRVPLVGKVVAKLSQMRAAMQTFWGAPRVVGLSLLYSFGYHALTVVNVYVAARVLGIEVSFIGLCAVTPIILVIAALPTTPGSIGVWEWAYSVLLLPIGAELEQGLAIALVLRGQLLFASLVGGVLYLAERRAPAPQDLEKADG
ncbi:lysylphosphatidylglycerol synthase transmembrane domain-containing protein [Actibacterium sp. 188UL27-1]|uniref:lysylphosphatidylglycerol synthase transmembrane domain-containing protein n=1 Tax=Actibacterium sp. 188UL27-1 TaxID=2786961 RepID=UPI00195E376D|nr:lysylphosphatidylglycerol synthase transmembrane domain-containing protein [Actibacterium sp. 188UL27-1]MBM7068064.1 flippase-like domain-containing protein [Actibacterium sp. 188UL27-1]